MLASVRPQRPLEVLVHLSSITQMPEYICVKAKIPDHLILSIRDLGPLPTDWATRAVGCVPASAPTAAGGLLSVTPPEAFSPNILRALF